MRHFLDIVGTKKDNIIDRAGFDYKYFKMISAEEKKCNQCLQCFHSSKLPLKMPGCKHNLCNLCLKQIKQSKLDVIQCQFCDFTVVKVQKKCFQPNRPLTNKLKSMNQFQQNSSQTSNSLSNSFLQPPPQRIENQILLMEQQHPYQEKYHQKPQVSIVYKKQAEMCEQHEKHLEIICVNDLKMICPHCAIFGNHKDHYFKTLKQFKKDCESNYEKLQIVKQQKYMIDKKIKNTKEKQNVENLINEKKAQIRRQVDSKFQKLLQQINNVQTSICEEINKSFSLVYKQIMGVLEHENKLEGQFTKWQSQCENTLDQIEKSSDTQEKIKTFYGNLTKIDQGQQLADKLEKKFQAQNKKIQGFLNSVSVQFKEGLDISKYFKVTKKQQQTKKDSFVQMLQKINLPLGKHDVDDITCFDQNSFVSDFTKQDFSLILDGQTRRAPTKSVMSKRNTSKKNPNLNTASKFKSPTKKTLPNPSEKLIRAKSNGNIGVSDLMRNKPQIRINQTTLQRTLQMRDPQTIISDFIKHDLKQVLDLSRCQLNDELAFKYLKQVKRHRKIRGLKLCQNELTDAGFAKIIEFLGSTSNLNLSYNKLTEQSLSTIINNRDQISPLRIVNLSSNNLNQKRSKARIDALKKMGIIVNV